MTEAMEAPGLTGLGFGPRWPLPSGSRRYTAATICSSTSPSSPIAMPAASSPPPPGVARSSTPSLPVAATRTRARSAKSSSGATIAHATSAHTRALCACSSSAGTRSASVASRMSSRQSANADMSPPKLLYAPRSCETSHTWMYFCTAIIVAMTPAMGGGSRLL
jgi:hypothetical protein